ncbi:MAG: 50S ribosomal protein L34 [Planctomycetes bacterium]|nr:50S ribosomal protein L34 [Planctomycetota bacterium]
MKTNIRKSNIKRRRLCGFRRRSRTPGGRNILRRRRARGAKRLTVV